MNAVCSNDGTSIAWFESGSGPALVLVHGTTADHARWTPVSGALETRFTVHAMDWRGRGASGDAETYAIEREFEDVAAVVDAVHERTGEPVLVLGHSYGAACSLGASLLTSNVLKLVLYEPPIPTGLPFYPPALLQRLDEMLARGRHEDVVLTFFRDVACIPPAEIDMLRSLPNWPARVAAAHTIPREMTFSEAYPFEPERHARSRVPTLLLLGGDSPTIFEAAVTLVADTIPTSRVAVLPGQRHAAMNTAPDMFVGEVVRFFSD